jgi:hypothetical protein
MAWFMTLTAFDDYDKNKGLLIGEPCQKYVDSLEPLLP